MLTQNKKIITFAVITLLIILTMLGFLAWMIKYLAKGFDTALNYKGSADGKTQSFNFKGLQDLGIKEIDNLLIATSTPTSTNSTSTSATSTSH